MPNRNNCANNEAYLQYYRDYYTKDKIKKKARSLIFVLKRAGTLKYKSCEKCCSMKTEAHHDDYTKPHKIRFLCKKHHWEFHKAHKYNPKTFRYVKNLSPIKAKKALA